MVQLNPYHSSTPPRLPPVRPFPPNPDTAPPRFRRPGKKLRRPSPVPCRQHRRLRRLRQSWLHGSPLLPGRLSSQFSRRRHPLLRDRMPGMWPRNRPPHPCARRLLPSNPCRSRLRPRLLRRPTRIQDSDRNPPGIRNHGTMAAATGMPRPFRCPIGKRTSEAPRRNLPATPAPLHPHRLLAKPRDRPRLHLPRPRATWLRLRRWVMRIVRWHLPQAHRQPPGACRFRLPRLPRPGNPAHLQLQPPPPTAESSAATSG